ncbi:MAG: magnesium/cobalt transporter CorA [Candidatus Thorarchaeota archaeon]
MSGNKGLPKEVSIAADKSKTRMERTTMIVMIDFSPTEIGVYDAVSIDDCVEPTDSAITRWVHLKGLHDRQSAEQIGRQFGIHSLLVEDILNPRHRPKLDATPDQFCLILREFRLTSAVQMESEQVSIIVGSGFVLSFQESDIDFFSNIRQRLSNPKSRVRNSKSDFLGYLLIDALVDRYIAVMDSFDDRIQALEDALESWDKTTLNEIYRLRHLMGVFQRTVRPLREAVSRLIRDESEIVMETSRPYLRDLYDHLLQVGEMADAYLDNLSNMLEIHLLRLDTKTNETVKVLTVVSTILLPLTLIASIFGMNFQNMPFQLDYAYPLVVLIMIVIGVFCLFYFRRRQWI